MTSAEWLILAPWLVLAGAALALSLLGAFVRRHGLLGAVAALALLLSLLAVPHAADVAPRAVTPLFNVDGHALFWLTLLLSAALAVVALAYGDPVARTDPPGQFHALILLATLGAAVLVAASHFTALVLGLALLTLPLAALIAHSQGPEALDAGIKYLLLAGLALAFALFGVALIHAATGSLTFSALAGGPLSEPLAPLPAVGLALVLAGLAFHLSLVPFHLWTPDVYAGAPPAVTAFLATVPRCAALAGLLRLLQTSDALATPSVMAALTLMALATLLAGHLLALLERNLVRLLAYSSIAQAGYLLVPLVAGGAAGGEAAAVYALAYGVMALAAFGAVSQLEAGSAGRRLEDCAGLAWRRPLLALLLATAMLALAGLPPTLGFIGRFYLFAAALEGDLSLLLVALLVASALGLYVHLRVIAVLFAHPAMGESERRAGTVAHAWPGWLVLCLLTGLILVPGLYPDPVIGWVRAFATAPMP